MQNIEALVNIITTENIGKGNTARFLRRIGRIHKGCVRACLNIAIISLVLAIILINITRNNGFIINKLLLR